MLKMKEIFETTEIDVYLFNSWSRFPIYEADFGWERPEWVSSVYAPMEGILLLDSNDGDGIEAWVRLKEIPCFIFNKCWKSNINSLANNSELKRVSLVLVSKIFNLIIQSCCFFHVLVLSS